MTILKEEIDFDIKGTIQNERYISFMDRVEKTSTSYNNLSSPKSKNLLKESMYSISPEKRTKDK